jgi:hypothetical protein
MTAYRVTIPDEKPRIIEFVQDGLYGIAYINRSLIDFQPKEVFSWHLSIMLDIEDTVRNGMPSKKERALLDEFGDVLDTNIRGQDKQKPNALFLARITWNNTRELIWRLYDPELADKYLQQIIDANSSPRPFDYRIDPDKDWKLAEWHLTRNI